jgi:hypothetical protein
MSDFFQFGAAGNPPFLSIAHPGPHVSTMDGTTEINMAVWAMLSMFAPDPTLERNIRLAEEAQQEQHGEEGQGADKDP